MAIFVYAPIIKEGTREFIEALGAKRLVKFDGLQFLHKGRPLGFDKGDIIICWGGLIPDLGDIKVFNSHNNYSSDLAINKNLGNIRGYYPTRGLPLFPAPGYANFKGPLAKVEDYNYGSIMPSIDFPGYVSGFFNMSYEYDIHVFNGNIIRVEQKLPIEELEKVKLDKSWRPGKVHPYIRSRRTGWQLVADLKKNTPFVQKNTIRIMEQFNLQCGVVSVGTSSRDYVNDGLNYIVLRKILTTPDLSNKEVFDLYLDKVRAWIKEQG